VDIAMMLNRAPKHEQRRARDAVMKQLFQRLLGGVTGAPHLAGQTFTS
jgi:hypothetical protein